jgi:hypothetical protein
MRKYLILSYERRIGYAINLSIYEYIHAIIRNNRIQIQQRRENLWTLLTRGMKRYEIAKVQMIIRDGIIKKM